MLARHNFDICLSHLKVLGQKADDFGIGPPFDRWGFDMQLKPAIVVRDDFFMTGIGFDFNWDFPLYVKCSQKTGVNQNLLIVISEMNE